MHATKRMMVMLECGQSGMANMVAWFLVGLVADGRQSNLRVQVNSHLDQRSSDNNVGLFSTMPLVVHLLSSGSVALNGSPGSLMLDSPAPAQAPISQDGGRPRVLSFGGSGTVLFRKTSRFVFHSKLPRCSVCEIQSH